MLNPPSTQRNRMSRTVSRSASEEIPVALPQQQYVISASSLPNQHSGVVSNDIMFLNGDGVMSRIRT